ncbi:hypothetical protein BKA56DRAFT_578485 [Ilyonectria sp. MPI-CAGE-AT-0026]|nr:hypothetical protein BKA56DRAFT_578485 [Ilyonectria sp. MPI-CAGE-AT-0026]
MLRSQMSLQFVLAVKFSRTSLAVNEGGGYQFGDLVWFIDMRRGREEVGGVLGPGRVSGNQEVLESENTIWLREEKSGCVEGDNRRERLWSLKRSSAV